MLDEIRINAVEDGYIEIEAGDPSFGGYDGWAGRFPKNRLLKFAKELKDIKRNEGKIYKVEEEEDEFGMKMDASYDDGEYTMGFYQYDDLIVEETLNDNEFKNFLRDLVKAIK